MDSNGFTAADREAHAARTRRAAQARYEARRTRKADPRKLWVLVLGSLFSIVTGWIMVAHGTALNQAEGSAGFWSPLGIILIITPILAGAGVIIAGITREGAAQARRYQAWKASLSPQDRAMVKAAEATAMVAGSILLHQHSKAVNERLRSSVMGHTMPDGVTPRPTDRIRARHEQQGPS
jgi:hypothetical protein